MHSHIVFTLVTAMFMQYNPAYTFRTTKFSWLLHLGSAVSLKCPIDNYMYYSPTEYVVIPQRSCFICCDYRAEIAIKKSIRKWEKCAKKKINTELHSALGAPPKSQKREGMAQLQASSSLSPSELSLPYFRKNSYSWLRPYTLLHRFQTMP